MTRIASTLIAALVGSLLTVPTAAAVPAVTASSAGPATSSTAVPSSAPVIFPGPRAGVEDPDARVAFMRDCGVWIARPDGSDATNLTPDLDLCAIQPAMSRTGRYVAFGVGVGSGSEVWIHDRQTGTSAPLPAAVGGHEVAFSPVTDELAFSRYDASVKAANLYSIGVDGSGLKQWTFDSGDSGMNFAPSWSADGSSILHTTTRGSWHCRIDRGGYYDLPKAYWLARVTAGGAVTEVARSDAFSIVDAAEGGGVLAYLRQPMPPGPSGGICAYEPGIQAELVVNGEVVDAAATIGGVTVSADGDVAYTRGDDVVVLAAGGAGEVAVFPGLAPSWGVGYGAGGGSGGEGGDDDPPKPRLPVARCDVYWTKPGSLLRVPQSRGLLVNDHDPEGRAIRPLITLIGFRKASHPYTVSRDGSFVLRTLPSDRRLYLDYRVRTADGRKSATARINILVSRTKPAASALKPCPPVDEVTSRDLRAKKKKPMPTAFPSASKKNLDLLYLSMRSWKDWQRMLKNKNKSPYWSMDFAHDNCSAPGNAGNSWGFRFTPYCVRHDFAYRNALWLGVFNETRAWADRNFYLDLMGHCAKQSRTRRAPCEAQAAAFYTAVRKGGGHAVPETRKSHAGAGSVRIVTVFNPVDNFYIRGWVRDDKADGANVRLQYTAAVTGPNKAYRTVAQTTRGKGTQKAFDLSYNGKLNLKGIYFRICLVDGGKPACGQRFYVNKPD